MKQANSTKLRKMTATAILVALVVVLQALSIAIGSLNPVVSFTLALVPIVVGAILYGPAVGAILGTVMGAVVFASVVTGQAGPLSTAMLNLNPIVTFLVCISKTSLAGFFSGLFYRIIAKARKEKLAIIVAALVCPIVNTGLFLAALLTVFYSVAASFADGDMIKFVFIGILGVNFILEFIINSALSPAIIRIVEVVGRKKK